MVFQTRLLQKSLVGFLVWPIRRLRRQGSGIVALISKRGYHRTLPSSLVKHYHGCRDIATAFLS